ncbi:MAG: zinc-binding dehydrogenase [Pseudomonadales bacterium]|nr:zinc-binding dehydrogenase [Pseudomonadales bacterium]
MKSRAIVQTGQRQLELRQFDIPEIGEEEGLLRIQHSGVCGSDWSQYKNGDFSGVVPGHEPVGIIEEIGSIAAKRWNVKKGDRVAVETMLPCGFCRPCVSGKYNLCIAAGEKGINAYGYHSIDIKPSLWGGHAEFMYLDPHTLLHKVNKDIAPELAVMFNPLGAGVRWAGRLPQTKIGDVVVILGCGQRGLTSVIGARESGARMVIVTGLSADAHKLEIAKAFGADRTVDVEKENIVDVVREMTDGVMADVVVEVTSGATQPVVDSLKIAGRGGRIVLAGAKYTRVPEFNSNILMRKELVMMGALAVDFDAYEAAIGIIESGKYPLELMHTHTFSLDQADMALRVLGNEVEGEHGIHVSITP